MATYRSIPPYAAHASPNSRSTSGFLPRSPCQGSTESPAPATGSLSAAVTRHPATASSRTSAAPMPDAAPVTTADLPASFMRLYLPDRGVPRAGKDHGKSRCVERKRRPHSDESVKTAGAGCECKCRRRSGISGRARPRLIQLRVIPLQEALRQQVGEDRDMHAG